jgi:hypothetical protein
MQLLVDAASVDTYKVLQDEVAQLRVLAENGEIWMQRAKSSDLQDMEHTEAILRHITSLCYRFGLQCCCDPSSPLQCACFRADEMRPFLWLWPETTKITAAQTCCCCFRRGSGLSSGP